VSIISLPFLVFFPLVLILYYIFPRRLQNWLLLIASYIFCATWAWEFGVILLGSTLLNFYLARLIESLKSRDRRSITARQWSKLVFLGGIGLNVLVLVYFKYSNFFQLDFQMLLAQLGLSSRAGTLGLLLPVGLSFYTLGAISYLVDVDQENIPASQDLIDFGLYMAYFPKLLAGPIERARDFLPKLAQDRVVDNEILARSVTLIAVGLVQVELLVAANLLEAPLPDHIRRQAQSDVMAGFLAARIPKRLFPPGNSAAQIINRHLFRLLVGERWRERRAYLHYLLSPNVKDEAQRELPESLALGYYGRRLVRVARNYGLRAFKSWRNRR
jgi:alginate O-acetyltransferase complex protein AlgI